MKRSYPFVAVCVAHGERQLVDSLSVGAHSFLALIESWPHSGKLATILAMEKTNEGMRRLLAELRTSTDSDYLDSSA